MHDRETAKHSGGKGHQGSWYGVRSGVLVKGLHGIMAWLAVR